MDSDSMGGSAGSFPFFDCVSLVATMRPDDTLETFSELAVRQVDESIKRISLREFSEL